MLGKPVDQPVQAPPPLDGAGCQVGNQSPAVAVKIFAVMAVETLFQGLFNVN